jgi:hypothetical protein
MSISGRERKALAEEAAKHRLQTKPKLTWGDVRVRVLVIFLLAFYAAIVAAVVIFYATGGMLVSR